MSSLKNDVERYRLPEDIHQLIFLEEIVPKIFGKTETRKNPIAVIFGGQPGAGKSIAVDLSVEELKLKGGCALIIGDEFRDYHPDYGKLLKQNDKTAAFYTDKDTGLWVEKSIAHAKKVKCNLVIEGTMRVPEKVAETMKSLRDVGYFIEARALAVNKDLSWLGVLQRYERQRVDRGFGRMTTPEAHQAGYEGMPNTLELIEKEKLADKVKIYKRGVITLYENELQEDRWKHPPQARLVVENERNREWTRDEKLEYAYNFDKLLELIKLPERKANPEEIKFIEELRNKVYFQLHHKRKSASKNTLNVQ